MQMSKKQKREQQAVFHEMMQRLPHKELHVANWSVADYMKHADEIERTKINGDY